MQNYICNTCGVQHGASDEPPSQCLICEDERQYVGHAGQSWTTLAKLAADHVNVFQSLEPGLTEIVTEPKFAIGQRALLVETPAGNVLWDCLSLIDDETVATIMAMGGISALASSHPHMYGSMVAWSHAFANAPIFLHAANQRWVMRPDPVIEFWEEESYPLVQGVTLHRCGGHFTGSMILEWPQGAEGRGVLLTSDTMYVAQDRKHVSLMYSYPNYIPVSASVVDEVFGKVTRLSFDRIYGHFSGLVLSENARVMVRASAERYKKAIRG